MWRDNQEDRHGLRKKLIHIFESDHRTEIVQALTVGLRDEGKNGNC